ncbi:protein phosphatase 1F-like [Asterias amurensis]|uniref:protein phosphatase 1F-like n=1 Tax=Asterias amurensis TaxID=7602 RepID=UPI003AB558A8
MGSDPNLDEANFKKFLEEFSSTHAGTDNLPFSSLTCRLTKEEIEGECLEWVTNCLVGQNKAPPVLAAAIARATVDLVLAKDLSTFVVNDEVRYGDEEDMTCTLFDAGQIFPLVWTTINDICERWKTELPDLTLPTKLHPVSQYAVKNTRKRMEDKHVIIPDLNTLFNLGNDKPRSFYAVYDGHGGTDAAMYACQHLHCNAVRQDCFLEDPSEALAKSFHITDEGFLRKARREGLGSGTTGVAVIIEPDKLHISWLGDSQVMLMKDGEPIDLMEPHKPERPDEKKRIEQLGGCVLFFGVWRVNGTLAVSRAIGDPDQKPYVSSDADFKTLPLTGTEDCVVIACDGLWDVVTPKEVCRIIQEGINSGSDKETLSHRLVVEAKNSGSNDNITVLLIFLNPIERNGKDAEATVDGEVDEEETKDKEDGEDTKEEEKEDGEEPQVDGESQQDGGSIEAKESGASEPTDSETNSNNNNRRRAGSDTGVKRSLSHPGSNNLVVGNRINLSPSPKLGERKQLHLRQRAGSGESTQNSESSGSPSLETTTRNEIPKRKPVTVTRHKSMPSSKRVGKATSRINKSHSVKNTNKTNKMISDLITPTSDLEISSQQIKRDSASKRTAPVTHTKSMPISIKPKSMQRTKSSSRQLELARILKIKPKYNGISRFPSIDP